MRCLACCLAMTMLPLHAGLTHAAPGGPPGVGSADVRPQDDLFRAVNGGWLKDTPIPSDKAAYGSFYELSDRADERVRALVESLAATPQPAGSIEQKIGSFYRSYLDEAAIDRAGMAAAAPWLAQVDALRDKAGLAALMGRLQGVTSLPIGLVVDPDLKDPGTNLLYTWQGGLGLPDRDYYLGEAPSFVAARAAYRRYLETLLGLAGNAQPGPAAQLVYTLEERLAAAQWTKVANRDVLKVYNPTRVPDLASAAPGFAWRAFFDAAALQGIEALSVAQPDYNRAVAQLADGTPLAVWQLYLKARLLDGFASVLPKAARDADFAFHGKALQGLEQAKPRWQQATAVLDGALGEGIGRVYVARHFPPAYKERMLQIVAALRTAYDQSIDGLSWMSAPTKLQAKDKLRKITTKIGYPDTWRDYGGLEVRDGDALGNLARAGRFEFERQAALAGKPVDRRLWAMTPQTVNAYYNPSLNEIVFPAAILEPPFFDMQADDAVNFGGIGAVIGHEISHGFDDQGSRFDGDGRLREWWTAEDRKAFDALGDKLANQFGGYEPIKGHRVDGRLTLGENIADLSGLQIALKAYHLFLDGKPAPTIEGASGDQRFFMGWAQVWRGKAREERAIQLLTVDPHAPPEYRTNGAAVNSDGFHDAFKTQAGDGMYKAGDARIRIW